MASKKKSKTKPNEVALAALAVKGDVDALFAIADLDVDSDHDRLAYKWLSAASDLGHAKKANPLIEDVLEVTSLRYDDDRYETSSAHYELAALYLEGAGGLPFNLKLAKSNLEQAFELHDLEGLSDGTSRTYSAKALLARLQPKAKALLLGMLEAAPLGGDDAGE